MSHTPGPWKAWASITNRIFHVWSDEGNLICELRTSMDDARLIAAAPDLLAALRQLCEEFELSAAVDDETTTPYRALIAKAEGREP